MRVLVGTWNVGARPVPRDIDLSPWLQSIHHQSSHQSAPPSSPHQSPSLIIVAFQEISSVLASLAQAPIGRPGLPPADDNLAILVHATSNAIRKSFPSQEYSCLATHRMVSIAMCVFATDHIKDRLLEIRSGDLGVGFAVPFAENLSLCFVTCHLMPHEGAFALRNRFEQGKFIFDNLGLALLPEYATYSKVAEKLLHQRDGHVPLRQSEDPLLGNTSSLDTKASASSHALESILAHDAIIVCGDLNFRLDKKAPDQILNDLMDSVNIHQFLADYDELTKARQNGIKPFTLFREPELTFPPTYKLKPLRDRHTKMIKESRPDGNIAQPLLENQVVDDADQVLQEFSKKRRKAYPDRILYYVADSHPEYHHHTCSSQNSSAYPIIPIFYKSPKSITWSDHRPVVALLDLNEAKIAGRYSHMRSQSSVKTLQVLTVWKIRRAVLGRFMDKCGLSILAIVIIAFILFKLYTLRFQS
ncbi:hypothetical protein SeMB42_g02314 [Synchytrium endobioticum]|uniref:Inositol polyphosphate-related phosphatase domain-containing protein n=1 Tax=Synchytrium endobioticum TaxID=286115 RepID=A0A507D5Q6_9FUNG|nr:hypothetical protein SeLEV6574_g03107 [Synchytrium endobioticum]TPX50241.1 hypothetical protein SeMB42_g02314 [Synchytrium endobioticum]